MQYIRETYKVPAKRGARVRYTGDGTAHLEVHPDMAWRLNAILPASAKGKPVLEGFDLQWSAIMENQFAGTSVDVVILAAQRSNAA